MRFTYKATNASGKISTGVMESATKESATATLIKQGLRPVLVRPYVERSAGASLSIPFLKPKVKIGDLVLFTRQLSTMISAGVPLARALSTLHEDANNKYLQEILASVTKDVESGLQLGDAFAKYPDVFSEVYVNMVRAGEEGGILDEILKRLALQVEQDASIRKKVKSAMMYPVVILVVTIIAFFGITMVILPKIGSIITDMAGPDASLPFYTQAMLGLSSFMQSNAILIFVVCGVGSFLLMRYIRTPAGKYQFHSLLLRLPVMKTIITKVAIARFSRTFASLMSSGVSILDAIAVTAGAIGNKVIEKELLEAAKEVKNGRALSESLRDSKHFPPIIAQMLAVGEETGEVDTVLIKVADFYEEEVAVTIDGLASIIEPIMIVVLGAGVGLVAASVMGPIAGLSKNISGG